MVVRKRAYLCNTWSSAIGSAPTAIAVIVAILQAFACGSVGAPTVETGPDARAGARCAGPHG